MQKISTPTKSFIILLFIAVFGTIFSLNMWGENKTPNNSYNTNNSQTQPDQTVTIEDVPPEPVVDTSTWKTYTNSKLNFSFKYKPDWKVLSPTVKQDYTILQIDPGKKYYNIKIYVSPKDYYVMSGLPFTTESIAGQEAMNVSNLLYGIKYNNNFYTFDIGLSVSLKADFKALVHSVTFP